MVHFPVSVMTGILLILVLITVSGMAGGSFTFVDPTIFDWVVPNGRASLDNEAVNDAENRASQGFTLTRGTDSSRARFWMTFEWGGGDIFNAKNVQSMCETEQIFLTGSDYTDFCLLQSSSCAEPTFTISHVFYGTSNVSSCPLLNSTAVSNRAEELYAGVSSSDPDVAAFSSFFMEKGTNGRNPIFTSMTRSYIELGVPLEDFQSEFDEESEQQQDFLEYYRDVKTDYFDAFDMESRWLFSAYREKQTRGDLTVKWYSQPLVDIESGEIANGDVMLAILSLGFVYAWMLAQMQSFFLGTFCMLQVAIYSRPTT